MTRSKKTSIWQLSRHQRPFHIPQAHNCSNRGIAPLIEKPLSLDLDGLPELEIVGRISAR